MEAGSKWLRGLDIQNVFFNLTVLVGSTQQTVVYCICMCPYDYIYFF